MKTLRAICAIAAAAALAPALAQAPVDVQQSRLVADHKIIFFGDSDQQADSSSYASLISRFYEDQFRHSQDPRAPYFMLMSRNADMAMGIGGQVEGLAYYDFDGAIPGTDFSPYKIAIPKDPARPSSLQASMGHTAIFVTVFGTDRRFGNYQLYVEGKFNGAGQGFKLSKAYATVGDWTLGYAKSTFVDPSAQPATVETAGPNSELSDKRFLLRYMRSFKPKVTVALSAEMPDDQVASAAGQYEGGSGYVPNAAAFVQYGTKGQHVRLSGVVKGIRYRNLVEAKNGYATGWGASLSTVFRPVAPLTVYAAANTGAGIGSMVNDLSCGDNDLIGLKAGSGEMYAPRSYGWYAALQYNYSPSVFSTVMFSQERMLPRRDAVYGADQYKYGLYGTANVFWNITPRCQVGAEFNVGKRCNIDGASRMAYRTGLMAQFSF